MKNADDLCNDVLDEVRSHFVRRAGAQAAAAVRSCGVLSASGAVIAQRTSAPVACEVLRACAGHVIARARPGQWRADELFIGNNPFLGGLSFDTIVVLAPILAAAGPAGMVGVAVRYPDIGAMAAEAFVLKRESRHEGFCLSQLRVEVVDDRLPEMLLAMLRANVRCPDETVAWLMAQATAARVGAARIASLHEPGAVLEGTRAVSRAQATRSLARLPAGRYRGTAFVAGADGRKTAMQVHAAVVVAESGVVVELATSGAGAIDADGNSPVAATRAGVMSAVADALNVPTHLVGEVVDVKLSAGSCLDARYPAAVASGSRAAFACHEAVRAALSAAGPTARDLTLRAFVEGS